MNKKGQSFRDLILMVVFLLFLAIAGLSTAYFSNQITTGLTTNPVIAANSDAVDAINKSNSVNNSWDWLILIVLFGFALSMFIVGWFIDVHTIFFPIFVLALLVGVIVVVVIKEVWEQVSQNSLYSTIADSTFPITNHIFSNFLLYYVVVAAIALVATYAKTRGMEQ